LQPSPHPFAELFHLLKLKLYQSGNNSPFISFSSPGNHHFVFWLCEFAYSRNSLSGNIYLSFCVWVISLKIRSSKFIHVVISIFKNKYKIENI
jgi:hypothetical protein